MTPSSKEELADIIRDTKTNLKIRGGGTRTGLGNPVNADAAVSTAKLSGITMYEPAALTLVVQAGTPLAEIEAALVSENQQLPFEPMDHRALYANKGEPTIGGITACNISGPRRIQAGACRDSLLGVEFIDGRGDLIKNGGRVMKNVTGYDLVKLMAGSFGTLGVLTELSFRVLPKPERSATIVLHGLPDAEAIAALCNAMGSPNDVTGAAHVSGENAQTLIRIEGFDKSVTYRTEQLKSMFLDYEMSVVDDASELWKSVKDAKVMAAHSGDVWRISVKPTDAPGLVENLRVNDAAKSVLYDWSGGLIWIGTNAGVDLRALMGTFSGHASRIRGLGKDNFVTQNSGVARIEAGLREQFDPRGILNTGILG